MPDARACGPTERDTTLSIELLRGTPDAASPISTLPHAGGTELLPLILGVLDDAKAEDIVNIDLAGKSSLADAMVVTQGRSQRHVAAIAEQLVQALKDNGHGRARVEGLATCDWVLVDAGDVIVHVFRPEVRDFYNLEKMWSAGRPAERLVV